MRRWITLLLPLVGLAIFVWIVRGIGLGNILDIIRRINPVELLIFPVIIAFILWMHGLRWQYLMRMIGIDYSLWRSTMVWAIGFFGASVTPGKVGDALRGFYLSKDTGHNFAECFLTVVIDRLLDVFAMLVLGVGALVLFSYYYIELPSITILLACAPLIVGLIYLLLHRELMRKLLRPFFRWFTPERYREELSSHFHSFYDGVGLYLRNWKRTSVGFIYTLLFWAAVVFFAYSVARVLDIDVSPGYLVLILPMLTLAEVVPISVSGLGTRDVAAIYLFSIVGIGSTQAVAFSLLYLLLGTYLMAMVGLIAWVFMPARLRKKLREPSAPGAE